MKKVLAITLVFALFTISASAQNEKTEKLRRHLIEQRLQNREGRFRNEALMKRQMILRDQMMRERNMRYKALTEPRARKMRIMQQQQRRKMMLRRYYMHRRVI